MYILVHFALHYRTGLTSFSDVFGLYILLVLIIYGRSNFVNTKNYKFSKNSEQQRNDKYTLEIKLGGESVEIHLIFPRQEGSIKGIPNTNVYTLIRFVYLL